MQIGHLLQARLYGQITILSPFASGGNSITSCRLLRSSASPLNPEQFITWSLEFLDRQYFSKHWAPGKIIKVILVDEHNGNCSQRKETTRILSWGFQCAERRELTRNSQAGEADRVSFSLRGFQCLCMKTKMLMPGSRKERCICKIQDRLGRCESGRLAPVYHAGPEFQYTPSQFIMNTCIINQTFSYSQATC